jgi:hypothetical protein
MRRAVLGGVIDGEDGVAAVVGLHVVKPGNALKGHGRTRRADLAEALVLAVTEDRWPRQALVVAT